MKYVIDNNTLASIFKHYFVTSFKSFWLNFNKLVDSEDIVSVREVKKELEVLKRGDKLDIWAKAHPDFFQDPTADELSFITSIYSVDHFKNNLDKKKLLRGGPFADPFIVAKAKINYAIVITQESFKLNAAKIPNICKHFGIQCIDLEGFIDNEKWQF